MVDISTPGDLADWLEHKPRDWAQVIAARIALRVAPLTMGSGKRDDADRLKQAVFRATAISWAARSFAAHEMDHAVRAAARAVVRAAADTGAGAAAYAADAAAYAAHAARASADVASSAGDAVDAAAHAGGHAADQTAIWQAISDDLMWLDAATNPMAAARQLANRKLWFGNEPKSFTGIWAENKQSLLIRDRNFRVWTDWYDRRLRGERAAFDIPGDRYRQEDKAILRKLAAATDEDFWNHGAEYVNAELSRWLVGARKRAAERAVTRGSNTRRLLDELFDGEVPKAEIPAQAIHAVRFGASADGRITIDASALVDTLKNDSEAQDRHAAAIELARAMLAGCEGSNAGARMTAMLTAYLDAAGDSPSSMRPSLFVQRGERLRQELAGYETADTMLAPLPDTVLADSRSWRSAHNMVVGLDPVLMALDTAQLGPDVQPTVLSPNEIRNVAVEADEAGALEDGVSEVVIEAADIAPKIPDPSDRRTIWSSETAKNLVIEAFALALNYPLSTLSGIVAFGTMGWSGAGVFAGALAAAKFLIGNRNWITARMGNSPTWQSLFEQLCDRLERHTPFKPKETDDD
jgi:hypothetical protein